MIKLETWIKTAHYLTVNQRRNDRHLDAISSWRCFLQIAIAAVAYLYISIFMK